MYIGLKGVCLCVCWHDHFFLINTKSFIKNGYKVISLHIPTFINIYTLKMIITT